MNQFQLEKQARLNVAPVVVSVRRRQLLRGAVGGIGGGGNDGNGGSGGSAAAEAAASAEGLGDDELLLLLPSETELADALLINRGALERLRLRIQVCVCVFVCDGGGGGGRGGFGVGWDVYVG